MKVSKILINIGVIGFLAYVSLILYRNYRVRLFLNAQKTAGAVNFSQTHFSPFKSGFSIDSLYHTFNGNDTISAEKVIVGQISFTDFFFKNRVHLKSVNLTRPVLKLNAASKSDRLNDNPSRPLDLKMPVQIDDLTIRDGQFFFARAGDSLAQIETFNLDISDIKITNEMLASKIPFRYGRYKINRGNLIYHPGKLQTIKVEDFDIGNQSLRLKDIRVLPNYSRQDYTKVIFHERDLSDVHFKMITIRKYDFDIRDSVFFSAENIEIDSANAKMYRNKLLPDDPGKTKLYSALLRELPLNINIDTLRINNSELSYEEVQEKTGKTGIVYFKKLNAEVTSLTNMNLSSKNFPTTDIAINALLMGAAPVHVDLSFKINDPNDNFNIRGSIHNISPTSINNFFIPAFNMEAEGEPINAMYFNFSGNKNTATGDFKMVYDNLKINALKKDGTHKNKALSFITNIFIKHRAKNSNKDIRVENVSRDDSRSFWNYFWQCMFTGIKNTVK